MHLIKNLTIFAQILVLNIYYLQGYKGENATSMCDKCICFNATANCSSNNLTEVPADLPDDIQTLLLDNNKLDHIQAKSFQRYRNLTCLDLTGNQLNLTNSTYSPLAFVGLRHLKVLRIDKNFDAFQSQARSLTYSYNGWSFGKLEFLETLIIDGIPEVVFDAGFKKMMQLTNITFGRFCYLNYVRETMFNNTPHLKYLNMSGCYIYDIHSKAFSPLKYIHTIDISENYGFGVNNASRCTEGLVGTAIRVLKLNKIVLPFALNVRIHNTSLVYLQKTNIKQLHLDHNSIVYVDVGTLDHYPRSLEVLSINDNRFTMGQYVYDSMKMTSLRTLYISDMAINHHFVHAQAGITNTLRNKFVVQGPPKLETIKASNFLMGGIISAMNINLSSIKTVHISNNVLTKWAGPVKYCTSLQKATLSRCFCSEIDPAFFQSFPNLKTLNVSCNLIGDQKNNSWTYFQSLHLLESLDLSTNKITSLPSDVFTSNTNLTHLYLSYNQLYTVSFKIRQLTKLIFLDLHENQIRSFPNHVLNDLDSMPKHFLIDLSNNPLRCTCDRMKFLIWAGKWKKFKNFNYYTCINENDERVPMTLELISSMKTKCKSVFGLLMAGVVCLVFVMSVSIMGLVYRYRWKLKYMYHVARDRYRPIRAEGGEERYFHFDAFVSFSDEDRDFVNTLVTRLEEQGRRLCVHHRDFKPGEPIAANIVKAVQRSRRTFLILSRNFLASHWCKYEFEMAKMESVHEERRVILVVKIQDLESADIPRELLYMMRTDSYAEFPDRPEDQAAFWVTLDAAARTA